jgi:hypothetical protein
MRRCVYVSGLAGWCAGLVQLCMHERNAVGQWGVDCGQGHHWRQAGADVGGWHVCIVAGCIIVCKVFGAAGWCAGLVQLCMHERNAVGQWGVDCGQGRSLVTSGDRYRLANAVHLTCVVYCICCMAHV